MKKSWWCFLTLALVWPGQMIAQKDAGVCEAAEKHYAAIRARDLNTVVQQHLPDFTFFTNDGALLWSFDALDQQRAEFGSDPTFESQVFIRHCSAQVYGDTGIATYYLTGSETRFGETRKGTWRVTEVWVRHEGEWKEAHHHESPLIGTSQP